MKLIQLGNLSFHSDAAIPLIAEIINAISDFN